jgi:hypothetical protein
MPDFFLYLIAIQLLALGVRGAQPWRRYARPALLPSHNRSISRARRPHKPSQVSRIRGSRAAMAACQAIRILGSATVSAMSAIRFPAMVSTAPIRV